MKSFTQSFLFIIRLDEDIVSHVHILTLVFNRSQELMHLIHLYFLLIVYFVWGLVQDAVFEEFYADLTVDRGKTLRLDDLEIFVHQLDIGLVRDDRSVDVCQWLRALRTSSCLLCQ